MPRKKVEPKQPERHFRPTRKKLKRVKRKKGIEFSKALCISAVIIFTLVAIFSIMDYYALMRLAIKSGSGVTPDASLPIAAITSILAAVLSYCLYQGSLKASLNKNKLTIDDNGIVKPLMENWIKDDKM